MCEDNLSGRGYCCRVVVGAVAAAAELGRARLSPGNEAKM